MPSTLRIIFLILFLAFGIEQAYSQIRLSTEDSEKLVIERPEAIYPAFAKVLKLEQVVTVEITVSETGTVTSSKLINGNPVFRQAALEAAKKRKYKPYLVTGKPTPFITTVELFFSLGSTKDEYEYDLKISQPFFEEYEKCRQLIRSRKWKEAESACKRTVQLADQFKRGRELERSGAYEYVGLVMLGQKRHQEAIEYFNRAIDIVTPKLDETDAELGQLFGELAIAYHGLGDLNKARELYRKAEKIYQAAYAKFAGDDLDEEVVKMRQGYIKALKTLFEFHLSAAEDAGAASEVEEIKKQMNSLP